MATRGQLIYFLLSVLLGFLGGFLWQVFSLFRLPFPKGKARRIATVASDCLSLVLWGAFCCVVSARFFMPDHRAYRYIGYALGFIIYLKTVKNLLDFLKNVCYNKLTKLRKSKKARLKREEHL